LTTIAKAAQNDVRPLLRTCNLIGEMGNDDAYARWLGSMLHDLDNRGVHGALQRALSHTDTDAATG
jgi:hypothetical protein